MTMTRNDSGNALEDFCEVLIEQGLPGLKDVLSMLLNKTMELEREKAIGAAPYERTDARRGHANGYKDRELHTRLGDLSLRIPQTRGIVFYPQCIEKGLRSERALKLAVAEMYVQGVSTRKVQAITEALCGYEVSSTQVSRLAQVLDGEITTWKSRRLASFPYVFFDARYEKIRIDGCVRDAAVLWAYGINPEGKREILGVSVALSEAEVHWRTFFQSLKDRGLCDMQLITSDDHAGLKAARKAVFPGVAWQRCQFHLAQNAQAYVPKQDLKIQVAQDLRDIFAAPTLIAAEDQLKRTVEKYTASASKLAGWMEANIPEGFSIYAFPRSHHKKIRTSNLMERINREIRRRTRVATLFPNEASCLRLIASVLMEINDEWVTGKCHLDMKELFNQLDSLDDSFYRKKVA